LAGCFEPDAEQASDPRKILSGCIESGSRAVLLEEDALPAAFFDLSTRFAGELLHDLGKYDARLAVVVRDTSAYSGPFQDFARESNRGSRYRFFPTRDEAVSWLEGKAAD
jgi:hypothetical protein